MHVAELQDLFLGQAFRDQLLLHLDHFPIGDCAQRAHQVLLYALLRFSGVELVDQLLQPCLSIVRIIYALAHTDFLLKARVPVVRPLYRRTREKGMTCVTRGKRTGARPEPGRDAAHRDVRPGKRAHVT